MCAFLLNLLLIRSLLQVLKVRSNSKPEEKMSLRMAVSSKKLIFGKEKELETVGLDTDLENDYRVFITCML